MFHLEKLHLNLRSWRVEAFAFLPDTSTPPLQCALFTHGYTSHKGSLFNWGVQLAQRNIPSIIFDLPGHYLGSFNEVEDFTEFNNHVHYYFVEALQQLLKLTPHPPDQLLIGGHSLGALLALRAATLPTFSSFQKLLIPVGFGVAQKGNFHPLQSEFFKPFLTIRRTLVSDALAPEVVLPWIETTKRSIQCQNERILLICGKDDMIVQADAVQRIVQHLQQHNHVIVETPPHLPHHQPELAIKFILRYLKQNF